ncbi:MAG TPA: acyl-CoA thioesterase [Dongiaceae bacterium]|nr:acyl-CoA thioesterase [Dongiaceae bacterium]
MWFFVRFFIARYIQKIQPSKPLLDWVITRYRVMPWDIDANLHMNNVKYLKYLERGRVEHMIHTPWLQAMFSRGFKALIANTEISYVKELKPFQYFKVETRISGWDDKYVYMEQVFTYKRTVFTAAVIRMAMVNSRTGKRVAPSQALREAFPALESPSIPASARALNQLVQAQRGETQAIADAHAAQDENKINAMQETRP